MGRFGVFVWLRLSGMIVQTVRASLPNLEEGTYKLGFVPMGDSPSKIRIDIKVRSAGSDFAGATWTPMFSEKFVLKGTPVDTGYLKILHMGVCWTEICLHSRSRRRGKL